MTDLGKVMKINIVVIILLATIHLNGQNLNCKHNIKQNSIVINNKKSYQSNVNYLNRIIELNRTDLRNMEFIDIACDTLTIISFALESDDCDSDDFFISSTNKLTEEMKLKISRTCCMHVSFYEIKAKGNSGNIYKILPVRVDIVMDWSGLFNDTTIFTK